MAVKKTNFSDCNFCKYKILTINNLKIIYYLFVSGKYELQAAGTFFLKKMRKCRGFIVHYVKLSQFNCTGM